MLKYQVRTLTRRRDDGSGSQASSDSCCSSTSLRWRGRSASVSSLSSAASSSSAVNDAAPCEWGTIKVHTEAIRADTDYKTLFISSNTTAHDLITTVLNKFRLTHKDPKLFYLCMELRTKVHGEIYESALVLDDHAKPLNMQQCHPRGMCRFVLRMRPGALVRIHDHCVDKLSNYKSIVISTETTCAEAIGLLLASERDVRSRSPCDYVLLCVNRLTKAESPLAAGAPLLSCVDASDLSLELHVRALHDLLLDVGELPLVDDDVDDDLALIYPNHSFSRSSHQIAAPPVKQTSHQPVHAFDETSGTTGTFSRTALSSRANRHFRARYNRNASPALKGTPAMTPSTLAQVIEQCPMVDA